MASDLMPVKTPAIRDTSAGEAPHHPSVSVNGSPRPVDAGNGLSWHHDLSHVAEFQGVPHGPHTRDAIVKRGLELVFSTALMILTAPVILVLGALVKLTSRGPVFYSQTRVGLNGRPFRLYKIRTMVHDCEKSTGPLWSAPFDPRITGMGRFLRRTHLDELPQLWNVLRGDMSLVGPRPERPEFVTGLSQTIRHYQDRLLVRPGVTGLAQVQLPADTDFTSVRRKLAYDLYYIRHCGFWLDLRLIACTAVRMCGVPFHILGRVFALPHLGSVEMAYRCWRGELAPVNLHSA
jgi:lipopolysaccharide/colanic/teichoic acid biosynthesis glycosyltransferase